MRHYKTPQSLHLTWVLSVPTTSIELVRGQLKCDGTRAETRFRLSAKRTSPFKSARGGGSDQSNTSSWGVHISGSNAGYIMFRGSVKGTGYPLHSPVSPSLPHPCVTLCHHISNVVYHNPLPLQFCVTDCFEWSKFLTTSRLISPYKSSASAVWFPHSLSEFVSSLWLFCLRCVIFV